MIYRRPPVHVGRPGHRREARQGGPHQVPKNDILKLFLAYISLLINQNRLNLSFSCIFYAYLVI